MNIRNIIYLFSAVTITACSSGSSNSNETSYGMYPLNNAQNVSPNQVITFRSRTYIESSEVNRNTFKMQNHSTSNPVIGKVVANSNGHTFYFVPDFPLEPNTTYDVNLSLPGPVQASSSNPTVTSTDSSSFTTSALPANNIFVTSKTYKGSLSDYDNSSVVDGILAGDYLCNTSSDNPDKQNTYYKAMLGTDPTFTGGSLRYACNGTACGGDNSYDWVLQSNTTYYNASYESIATTTNRAIMTYPLANPFSRTSTKQAWTGLSVTFSQDDSCTSWTRGVSDKKGRSGAANVTDSNSVSKMEQSCDLGFALYCVAQPVVVMSSPMNNESITDINTTINIRFNVVNAVNSSTVNSSTFTVSDGVNAITGSVTQSGSLYIFTPSTPLEYNKTYIVRTTGVLDKNGVPVRDSEFRFHTVPSKLWYLTQATFWGDLNGVAGADAKCQADTQCPTGSTCKAVISDNYSRIACTGTTQCGSGYSKDWVLAPNTYYANPKGEILGKTDANGIFPFTRGFTFSNLINPSGKAWTGLDPYWMSNSDAVCQKWEVGSSSDVYRQGGLSGKAYEVNYVSLTIEQPGSCSRYTDKDELTGDKSCKTNGELDGCIERGLYCVQM